ncbi:TPT-domain-containing protein [Phanerochaete sordida]|uniref:TPT-domain-containing protein n=1 Tax=Phanerochaete sordida TaxID=48140 RepID=A0A9P3G1Q9_9APHY|nr:TPT-domain-containing protein [Phanerochaete sordida]
MHCSPAARPGDGEWLLSPSAHEWASLSSPQVQVQALANSSPRLRHAFLRNVPSYSPSPSPPLASSASPSQPWTEQQHAPPWEPGRKPARWARPLGATLAATASACAARVDWGSQLPWLCLYFAFNLLLTLSNKSVLTGFPFPYTLTAIHALCSTLGGLFLRARAVYVPKRLDWRSELCLVAFSFLYAINVAVSNVSLHLVTVPFHQVIRAVTPLFTIALSALLLHTPLKRTRVLALLPVVFGVALATYGDYYFTTWGLCLTLLGTFLAALKTIYTSVLQSSPTSSRAPPSATPKMPAPATWGKPHPTTDHPCRNPPQNSFWRCLVPPRLDMHPLDLLTRMSPLAFVQCVIYAQLSGELDRLARLGALPAAPPTPLPGAALHAAAPHALANTTAALLGCLPARAHGLPLAQAAVLLANGAVAFGLNVVSFSANGRVGALSMTVAANVKQVLTVLVAVALFDLTIAPANALGIAVTLGGGAWYAWVEYAARARRKELA